MLGKKNRITFVAPHNCIRVTKEAMVLKDMGYEINLISERAPDLNTIYNSMSKYHSPFQLEQTIKALEKHTDLWVVHNEPTWPVTLIREVLPQAKIVLDYHDSNYWRNDPDSMADMGEAVRWAEEDVAMDCVDGVVCTSPAGMAEVKTRTDKPVGWLPPALPLSRFLYLPFNWMGGLASQGGHVAPSQVHGDHWRDYTELYKTITSHGKQVFVYSPSISFDQNKDPDKHYLDIGNGKLRLGKLPYDELLQQIGGHSWNLVGNSNDAYVWKYALPNKFFDSMASGTPSVVFGCTEVKDIVEEYQIGMWVESVEEFIDRWDEHPQYRTSLMLNRRHLSMESFIRQLTDLYDEVLS